MCSRPNALVLTEPINSGWSTRRCSPETAFEEIGPLATSQAQPPQPDWTARQQHPSFSVVRVFINNVRCNTNTQGFRLNRRFTNVDATLCTASQSISVVAKTRSKRYLKIVFILLRTRLRSQESASLKKLRHASIVDDKDERSGLVVRRTLCRDQSCAGFAKQSKNRRYVFVTARTPTEKCATELYEMLGKTTKRHVLEFLGEPNRLLFRNRSGVTAISLIHSASIRSKAVARPARLELATPCLERYAVQI